MVSEPLSGIVRHEAHELDPHVFGAVRILRHETHGIDRPAFLGGQLSSPAESLEQDSGPPVTDVCAASSTS